MPETQRDEDRKTEVKNLLWVGLKRFPHNFPDLIGADFNVDIPFYSFDDRADPRDTPLVWLPMKKSYLGVVQFGGRAFVDQSKQKLEALAVIMNNEIGLETIAQQKGGKNYLLIDLKDPDVVKKLETFQKLTPDKLNPGTIEHLVKLNLNMGGIFKSLVQSLPDTEKLAPLRTWASALSMLRKANPNLDGYHL